MGVLCKGSLRRMCRLRGSVVPYALKAALPNAAVTLAIKLLVDHGLLNIEGWFSNLSVHVTLFNIFSSMLGFLVVFRTSQAYARFYEGASMTVGMGGYYVDACSSLLAFSAGSEADAEEIK